MSEGKVVSGEHVHLSYVGSEYACPICNPACYKNHGFGRVEKCSNSECPSLFVRELVKGE